MTVEQDVYTRVTNKIIADLEKGNLTWVLCEALHKNHYAKKVIMQSSPSNIICFQ